MAFVQGSRPKFMEDLTSSVGIWLHSGMIGPAKYFLVLLLLKRCKYLPKKLTTLPLKDGGHFQTQSTPENFTARKREINRWFKPIETCDSWKQIIGKEMLFPP